MSADRVILCPKCNEGTFREYINDIGVDKAGDFALSYQGACDFCDFKLKVTLDSLRASLEQVTAERDEARLNANKFADGAFHNGKEIDRLRGRVTTLLAGRDTLRGEIAALRAILEEAEPWCHVTHDALHSFKREPGGQSSSMVPWFAKEGTLRHAQGCPGCAAAEVLCGVRLWEEK